PRRRQRRVAGRADHPRLRTGRPQRRDRRGRHVRPPPRPGPPPRPHRRPAGPPATGLRLPARKAPEHEPPPRRRPAAGRRRPRTRRIHQQADAHPRAPGGGRHRRPPARPPPRRRHRPMGHLRLERVRQRHPRVPDRRRLRRDPAQHHRRAGARPAPGGRRPMSEFSIAAAQEAIALAHPGRDAVAQGPRRLTTTQLTERTRRLAHVLLDHGLGLRAERHALAPYQSGQDHLAVYLHDGPEYLEAMLGAYKARLAPFNVNYRYVADELRYLLDAGRARAIVYHGAFTPILARVLADRAPLGVLLRVDDGSGHPLLPGALDYEAALAAAPSTRPLVEWSPDDLYLLFTGGTTGMPKAVMWRQADIVVAGMGVVDVRHGQEWGSIAELAAAAARPFSPRLLVAPPLMHGAGQWAAFQALLTGGTVVLPTIPDRRDPADLLEQLADQRVTTLVIVGDVFARPLIDELRRRAPNLESLQHVITGGAPLTPESRAALLELLPHVSIVDSVGSSESGTQGRGRSNPAGQAPPGCFVPNPGSRVVDEDRVKILSPGHDGIGWLATTGRIPLGYLDDPDATARTFPVIDGRRMAVAGDRAV